MTTNGPVDQPTDQPTAPPYSPLPPVRVPHPHVVVDPAICGGSPMVEGTRVAVSRLFAWHRQGATCATLLRRFPQLGPAKIFDALAFAYDNLDLLTADLVRERERLVHERERAEGETRALAEWSGTEVPDADR